MRLCFWGIFAAAAMAAQTAESIPFRALLSPRNLVPANNTLTASGTATIWLHLVRNADGTIDSASVDFQTRYAFADATTLTALHIHQGNATQTGPAVIDAGLPRAADVRTGLITLQAQSVNANVLRNLIANPAAFYVDIHTAANPAGAIRAQLLPAEHFVYLARLSEEALAAVSITGTRDRQGRLTSAEVAFDHSLPRGTVVRSLALTSATETLQAGEAPLGPIATIYANPSAFTAVVDTETGTLRGPLVRADSTSFSFLLGTTPSRVTTYSLRDGTGVAVAGYAVLDVNYRFAGETVLTPPMLVDSTGQVTTFGTTPVRSATGRGNLFLRTFCPTQEILTAPDLQTVSLNRLQARLAPPNASPPEVLAAFSGAWDAAQPNVARNGLMFIYGRQLAKASGGSTGLLGTRVPATLNGTTVTIGDRPAPILQISPDGIIAQVPNDVPIGRQAVTVTTVRGSGSGQATVAAAAPAVFFDDITADGLRAAVYRVVAGVYSQVTAAAPARPGNTMIFYGTGFGIAGVTAPPAGQIPQGIAACPRPVVTIGGRPAQVLNSLVPLGLPGLCQVAIVMPNAAGAGAVPFEVRIGNAPANRVYLDAALR